MAGTYDIEVAYVLAGAGAFLLLSRLWPRGRDLFVPRRSWPKVSIVIPARNEAPRIGALLESLSELDYPAFEVIVVDDRSTDDTGAVARRFPVTVVDGAPRPPGWTGKNWACHQGARVATGALVLFTDADTIHLRDSLRRSVCALKSREAALLSALPYHRAQSFWETLMGPFQLLLIALTRPYGRPRPKRLFAIGQYLLFDRKNLDEIGGYAAIRSDLADDLALANRVVRLGKTHHVYRGPPLFTVAMYATLRDFVAGWRRNFRLGFRYSHPLNGLEATLMIMALFGAGHLGTSWGLTSMTCICLLFMTWRQRTLGAFSALGVILLPWSLALFCIAASLAMWDVVCRRNLRWKERTYPVSGEEPIVTSPETVIGT